MTGPRVILRPEWGASPPKAERPALSLEPFVPVHDIGGGPMWPSDVLGTIKGIQKMEQNGDYSDFAYNWCVDYYGNEIEGRGDFADGATLGYAGNSFSILAVCNASAPGFKAPTAMLDGIARCIKRAQSRRVVAQNAYIDSHHWFDTHVTQSPTACCGSLIANIPDIRARMGINPPPTSIPTPRPTKVVVYKVADKNIATGLVECKAVGLGYFEGVVDLGKQVMGDPLATIHGPNQKTDGTWPWTLGATVRAQARGTTVVVGVLAPNWKPGNPLPSAHVWGLI